MSQKLKDIENLITPILSQKGIELVDLTYQKLPEGKVICFVLDKAGGITLDDCEKWSREIGSCLDQANLIDESYRLEVSSPGIYRILKKQGDFERFAGERVLVKTFVPIEGQRNFKGVLEGISNGAVALTLENQGKVSILLDQIAKANLDPIIEI